MATQLFSQDTVECILAALEQELQSYSNTAEQPCNAADIVAQMRTHHREAYDLYQLMEDLVPVGFKPSELLALRMLKQGVNPYTKSCWQASYAARWITLGLPESYAPALAVIFFYLIEKHCLTPYSADVICRQIVYGLRQNETLRAAIFIYVHAYWHNQLLPLADRITEQQQLAAHVSDVFAPDYL